MRKRSVVGILFCLSVVWLPASVAAQEGAIGEAARHNVIIFVADGLRAGSVNQKESPALWFVRVRGVNFVNSHSLFPTFTTANASAIATGHGLGDTGDFSNTIWVGYPIFDGGNFGQPIGSPTPFIENDQILGDLADHFHGNYLNEITLLAAAANEGYNTASIGKIGPVAIQAIAAIAPVQKKFTGVPATLVIDDATGNPGGFPLPSQIAEGLLRAGLSSDAPNRSNGFGPTAPWNNGYAGTVKQPGTRHPNSVQQQWFADAATRVVLPQFQKADNKPFLLLFWSRDPDGTQHNQGDSLGTVSPGINGESSRLAVQNADRNLQQILDWLDANPAVKNITDVFVTSDHGFATVSRREIDRTGRVTQSESAKHTYKDNAGNVETEQGTLPAGFLAIDLALGLKTNLFDPDRHSPDGSPSPYQRIRLDAELFQHPTFGSGLLGGDVKKLDGSDAKAIVTANGGSDLIYVPDHNPDTVKQIVSLLTRFDYVGAIFADDQFGPIPGALPLSAIGLVGSSPLPRPAIVVAFKVFYTNPADVGTAIQISDTSLQEGQGMHGGLGTDSIFNNMAAIGPDFKARFTDQAPVSNADIAPTIAQILGIRMPAKGKLLGRPLVEALVDGYDRVSFASRRLESPPADGRRTILHIQETAGQTYVDRACFFDFETVRSGGSCP